MVDEKIKEFYEEHKEDIELVKEHGGSVTDRAIARTIERLYREEVTKEEEKT